MNTLEIAVYEYDELNDTAKAKARDWFLKGNYEEGYVWADDAIKSLEALAEHFDGKMSDYSIDFFNCSHSGVSFDMPEMSRSEIQRKLSQLGTYNRKTLKGYGDCKLTGYCADESAIDGFRIAFKREKVRDLDELMQSAFDSWLKDCQSDAEYQNSDEVITDTIRANEYKFDAEGNRSVTL